MKQPWKKILEFGLLALSITLGVILLNYIIIRTAEISISQEKRILIVGDSNSECALNDSILSTSINFSESGSPYFYSYLKLKKVFDINSNIDTVLLSFAPHNIIDNGWLFDDKHIYSNFRKYYPLMEVEDFALLLKTNPKATLNAFGPVPIQLGQNILNMLLKKEILYFGSFKNVERDMLQDDIERLENDEPLMFFRMPESFKISEVEVVYLKKIIQLCNSCNKCLIFINFPKRNEILSYSRYGVDEFEKFYAEELSGIQFFDYSRLPVPDNCFGDLVHLNHKGSSYFSNQVKVNGFEQLINKYNLSKDSLISFYSH